MLSGSDGFCRIKVPGWPCPWLFIHAESILRGHVRVRSSQRGLREQDGLIVAGFRMGQVGVGSNCYTGAGYSYRQPDYGNWLLVVYRMVTVDSTYCFIVQEYGIHWMKMTKQYLHLFVARFRKLKSTRYTAAAMSRVSSKFNSFKAR